jgi:antitoxin MazE
MRAVVSKWGNSLAIRLPKAAADSLRVEPGTELNMIIQDDTVTIRRAARYRLEELVAQMRGCTPPESLDDPPVGEEFR